MHEELILSPTEEDLYRSHFHGLLPGQIEYPLGPIDPRLPFPIHFRFVLQQRRIIKTSIEIGWLHQGIEKLLEDVSTQEGIEVIRRLNPLCPNIFEHHFRLASNLEPLDVEILKADIRSYHLYFIQKILMHLKEKSLARLLTGNFEHFKKRFLKSRWLYKKLYQVGSISLKEALSYGLTGPSLKACQKDGTGNAWLRILAKLEAIEDPNPHEAPEGKLLISRVGKRVRIRTPAFAHAAALPLFLNNAQLQDLQLIMLSLGLVGTEIDR